MVVLWFHVAETENMVSVAVSAGRWWWHWRSSAKTVSVCLSRCCWVHGYVYIKCIQSHIKGLFSPQILFNPLVFTQFFISSLPSFFDKWINQRGWMHGLILRAWISAGWVDFLLVVCSIEKKNALTMNESQNKTYFHLHLTCFWGSRGVLTLSRPFCFTTVTVLAALSCSDILLKAK